MLSNIHIHYCSRTYVVAAIIFYDACLISKDVMSESSLSVLGTCHSNSSWPVEKTNNFCHHTSLQLVQEYLNSNVTKASLITEFLIIKLSSTLLSPEISFL